MKAPIFTLLILVAGLIPSGGTDNAYADDPNERSDKIAPGQTDRWWPIQKVPKAIVAKNSRGVAYSFLLQSFAGLAAKSVNKNRNDELVWIETSNADIEGWLTRFKKRQPLIESRGTFDAWQLVERFAKRGVIKAYNLVI